MSSVRMSVILSVRDVGGSGTHSLEILETNCTDNNLNIFALRSAKALYLLPGKHGVRKSSVPEHKSGNISETRKDRGKITVEGL